MVRIAIIFSALFFGLGSILLAQKPDIDNINRTSGTHLQKVTITGSGFNSDASQNLVMFGNTKAEVVSASPYVLEVRVPVSGTYDQISVANLGSGLVGYSSDLFLPVFPGSGLSVAFEDNIDRLESTIVEIEEDDGLYDLCACDFDLDGKIDLVTTNRAQSAAATSITVFKNTTGPTEKEPRLQKVNENNLSIDNQVRNVACGDLTGDGFPDLVVGKEGNPADRIYVFKFTGSEGVISFAKPLVLEITEGSGANSARRLNVHDYDGDGLADIIMTDQGEKKVFVFQNKTSNGTLSFPEANKLSIDMPTNTLGLEVVDLDGDKKPEIIAGSNLGAGLYIVKNESAPGNPRAGDLIDLNVSGNLVNLTIADPDLDGKQDIFIANFDNKIYYLKNNSSTGNINFASPIPIQVNGLPWNIAAADLDGDTRPELVITTNEESDPLTILKYNPGAGNFIPHDFGLTNISRNLCIADFSGDNKPDIAYTGDNENKVFVHVNKICPVPVIKPDVPDKICQSNPITLVTYSAPKSDFTWLDDMNAVVSSGDYFASIGTAGSYKVVISSTFDACSDTSALKLVEESGGNLPATPTITGDDVVCEDGDINLSTALIGGVTYFWLSPDGTQSSGNTLTVTGAKTSDAGAYSLVLESDGCRTSPVDKVVNVSQVPKPEIASSLPQIFCDGLTNTLSVVGIENADYQWYFQGSPVGTNSNTYDAIETGDYRVEVTNEFSCFEQSEVYNIIAALPPVASFEEVVNTCLGQQLQLQNTSTYQQDLQAFYLWDFGTGVTSELENPVYTYPGPGDYTLSLVVNYGNRFCSDTASQELSIIEFVALEIAIDGLPKEDDFYELCEGSEVELSVDAPSGEITWSTGSTDNSILVDTEGKYYVFTNAGTGCVSSDTLNVESFPIPLVTVVTGDQRIEPGGSVKIGAEGAVTYEWMPAETLSDPNIANPLASPSVTTTYTVTGFNEFGCSDKDSVTVFILGDRSVTLDTDRIFSPNGDGTNDVWIIRNIDVFEGCPISIINRRGQSVYEAQSYNNDWEGTNNGSDLPEGVYYYIINCGNSEQYTGDITLIR